MEGGTGFVGRLMTGVRVGDERCFGIVYSLGWRGF